MTMRVKFIINTDLVHDGRPIKWARFVSWTVTTPVLLAQIGGIGMVKWGNFNMNNIMIGADLLMILAGVTSDISRSPAVKWALYIVGCFAMILIFVVAWQITDGAIQKHRKNLKASTRPDEEATTSPEDAKERQIEKSTVFNLRVIQILFYISWTSYAIYYLLDYQTTCALSEDVLEVLYIISDALAKNTFGIIMWYTLWRLNDGDWNKSFNTEDSRKTTEVHMSTRPQFQHSPRSQPGFGSLQHFAFQSPLSHPDAYPDTYNGSSSDQFTPAQDFKDLLSMGENDPVLAHSESFRKHQKSFQSLQSLRGSVVPRVVRGRSGSFSSMQDLPRPTRSLSTSSEEQPDRGPVFVDWHGPVRDYDRTLSPRDAILRTLSASRQMEEDSRNRFEEQQRLERERFEEQMRRSRLLEQLVGNSVAA
jgi:bacteriorhodopsin